MNKLTKIFFALAVAALLSLSSVPAMAQFTRTVGALAGTAGPAFTTTSLPRQMRNVGLAETAGEVVLTNLTTFAGGVVLPDQSSIDFVFSTAIGNGQDTTNFSTNLRCNGAACPAGITAAQVGTSIIRVSFVNAAADGFVGFDLSAGDTITLFGVRVAANTSAGNITATMSGSSSAPSTNPITFTDPQRDVGVPLVPLTVAYRASQNILTCAVGTTNLEVKLTENYPAALATLLQEQGFSNTPTAASNAVQIRFTLSGLPAGLKVTPPAAHTSAAPTTTLTLTAVSSTAVTTTGADVVFTYNVTASNTGAVEATQNLTTATTPQAPITFVVTANTGNTIAVVGSPQIVNAAVSLLPISTTLATIPRFADNTQGAVTQVATVSDCVTRLLYSWVVNVAGYDTGVAIANTSEDDVAYGSGAAVGATAQSGTCTLTGYPAAGGTPISFTTANVPAGQTIAFTISGTTGFAGFAGNVLAVCNFLNAHSFAFITNGFGSTAGPGLAQGYQALVVPTGTRTAATGEGLGH